METPRATADAPVLAIQPHDRILIATIQPRAVDQLIAVRLRAELRHAAAADPRKPVILDISRLEFAPSAAIGVLVGFMGELILENRRLILISPTPRVRRALAVTRVDSLMELSDSLPDAFARLEAAGARAAH